MSRFVPVDELVAAIGSMLPDGEVQLRRGASGAVTVDVVVPGRVVVLEGSAAGDEWGVSPSVGTDEVFVPGHPFVYQSYDEAVDHFLRIVEALAAGGR